MVFGGGIIGNSLTSVKNLSTLPVAIIVVGTALTILPVNRLMSLFGRKRVFLSVCLYTIATIGDKSKVPHLSYVGDSSIGQNVNISAGVITCNYDGVNKHQTIIEDGAFIGSDTQLIAPITVGKNATIGAGSTITQDVPSGKLTLSRTKQTTVSNWKRKKKQ